jgi:inorganic pyrophosphatase/solute carrier family 25 iron transporter 28/37
MSFWLDVGCSAAAGFIARVPCHPLDTVKTVAMASEGSTTGARPLSVAKGLYAREGAMAFYRGIGIASFGSAPGVACYLGTYEAAKAWLPAVGFCRGNAESPLVHLTAGFLAETVSCVIWLPIDVVKERLQAQGPDVKDRYRNSWDGLCRVARHEGVRGLYKGYFMTLGSFGPFSAVYFSAFEGYKRALFGLNAASTPDAAQAFVAGALANVTGCVVTQPLEMVKTRYQIQRARLTASGAEFSQYTYAYTGMRDGVSTIIKETGVTGLWRGTVSRAAYTVPNAALTMMLFSGIKQRVQGGAVPE